jgi:CBS-domain-containing membrane protein
MARADIHLDAMLRHLGAAYYDSLHGRASRADVNRALGTVEEHVHEQPAPVRPGVTPAAGAQPHPGRWTRRVRDVMTTAVVTVDEAASYKEIARLLAGNRISGVPVLATGRQVVGMVTEADLLAHEDRRAWEQVAVPGHGLRAQQDWALTAGRLMSSPAVTIHPDATIAGAARAMSAHHARRLPVVDEAGCLLGIVSRRDLLSVFLRPDGDVAADVREILGEVLHIGPGTVTVTAQDGVVVLSGPMDTDRDLVAVAIRLAWGVDGVVDIIDRRGTSGTGPQAAAGRPAPAAPESS